MATERHEDRRRGGEAEQRMGCVAMLALLAFVVGCTAAPTKALLPTVARNRASSDATPEPTPTPARDETLAPSLATPPSEPPVVHHGIGWYRDAPHAALTEARAKHQLVVVDLWAAWCHTCLSMQEYVLTADKLGGARERFVFLAIDTDRPENAAFLQTLSISAWPTFYVLEPGSPPVVRGRWVGGASPGQFSRFLADAERTAATSAAGATTPGDPLSSLVAGDGFAARGEFAAAATAYERALSEAPKDWSRRSDTLLARTSALAKTPDASACVDAMSGERPSPDHPVSLADFAGTVLGCADALPPKDPRVRKTRRTVAEVLQPLCERGHPEFTPDDRGDACGTLIEAREALGDKKGALSAARARLGVLEAAAAGMPDEVALIYDFARSETLLLLGRGTDAVSLLTARERALPENFNPPHYLARVHRSLRQWEEGLAAIDRALALAYGPRRAGIFSVKVDLLRGAGRHEEARKTLEEQLATYRALPEGQKRPSAEQKLEADLRKLGEAPNAP
jgi:tetratricopeptide (TPR) repeat protein